MSKKPPDNGADNGKAVVVVGKVPQAHGGALNTGGTPGNAGGGSPPSRLRGQLREILEASIQMLRDIALGKVTLELTFNCPQCTYQAQGKKPFVPRSSDITRAIEIAAKYGLGLPNVGYDEELVDELAQATAGVLALQENGQQLASEIKARWVPILARKKTQAAS